MVPSVIHPDQCAYIKGRYISEAVRILADGMHYTEETNSPGILIFCDFEKAFDSVDWSCLFKTLETFNFGPSLTLSSPRGADFAPPPQGFFHHDFRTI